MFGDTDDSEKILMDKWPTAMQQTKKENTQGKKNMLRRKSV